IPPRSLPVNGAGEELLAGAALPRDQHGGAGARDLRHQAVQPSHLDGLPDHLVEILAPGQLGPQEDDLALERALLEGAANDGQDLLLVERLGEVIERAQLHGRHRGADSLDRGDQDHVELVVEGLDALQDLQPVHAGETDVQKHQIHLVGAHDVEGLGAVRDVENLVLVLQDQAKGFPQSGVVVHHQDGRTDSAGSVGSVQLVLRSARTKSSPIYRISGPRGDSPGRLADVDMGPGGRALNRLAHRHERDALALEIAHQRQALLAIGMHGHVHRVAVIEADAVVGVALAERADRQRAPETAREEALHAGHIGEREGRGAVEADEDAGGKVAAHRQRRQLGDLAVHRRLADDLVGVLDPALGLRHLGLRLGEQALRDLELALGHDLALEEIAPDLDEVGEALDVALIDDEHALKACPVLARGADHLRGQALQPLALRVTPAHRALGPGRRRRAARRRAILRERRKGVRADGQREGEREKRESHPTIVARPKRAQRRSSPPVTPPTTPVTVPVTPPTTPVTPPTAVVRLPPVRLPPVRLPPVRLPLVRLLPVTLTLVRLLPVRLPPVTLPPVGLIVVRLPAAVPTVLTAPATTVSVVAVTTLPVVPTTLPPRPSTGLLASRRTLSTVPITTPSSVPARLSTLSVVSTEVSVRIAPVFAVTGFRAPISAAALACSRAPIACRRSLGTFWVWCC